MNNNSIDTTIDKLIEVLEEEKLRGNRFVALSEDNKRFLESLSEINDLAATSTNSTTTISTNKQNKTSQVLEKPVGYSAGPPEHNEIPDSGDRRANDTSPVTIETIPTSTIQPPSRRITHVNDERSSQKTPESNVSASPTPATSEISIDNNISYDDLKALVTHCQSCRLCNNRAQTVFGSGTMNPKVMFIGHAPGKQDDATGTPFSDESGELLNKIIAAMKLTQNDVYKTNVVRCLPIDNIIPADDEARTCLPYLKKEIELVNPNIIVILGAVPLKILFDKEGLSKFRGHWLKFNGVDCMVTFHPSYLLRIPKAKRDVWQDMQEVMRKLEIGN